MKRFFLVATLGLLGTAAYGHDVAVSDLTVGADYLVLGIEHILTGWDHLAFLLGLILLGGSWQQLLKLITAFTVAHSLTLGLAASGVASLPPIIAEPVIALSIVVVALENLFRRERLTSSDRRPWYAFGFGLIHGFGFAGALAEVGLPRGHFFTALLSFNAGVEVGQLVCVALVLPLLAWLRSFASLRQGVVDIGSVTVGILGAFWFTGRVFGGVS